MSLLMFDGFELYENASFGTWLGQSGIWAEVSGSVGLESNGSKVTEIRTGNAAFTLGSSASNYVKSKDLSGSAGPIMFGAGIFLDHHSVTGDSVVFEDSTGAVLCKTHVDADSRVTVRSATDVVLADLGVFSGLRDGHFNYLELKIDFSASGSIVARNNAVEIANVTGVDTTSGNGAFARVKLTADCPLMIFDDLYICDSSGTAQNDFLGPVRIFPLKPAADASTTWTPNSGTTGYTQVDDIGYTLDSDSTYVESSTVGAKDIYDLEDLPAGYANPVAVSMYYVARHDDTSGGAGMAGILKSGATEVETAEAILTSSYRSYFLDQQTTNPDTGAAWTPAEINALQIGAIVKSNL